MLTSKQLNEIRELLEQSQNPVFFFDNDPDGLASFLLLRRYCGKGKGVAIKSFPELNVSYARKLHELKPDIIFILDKPLVDPKFISSARELGIAVVWIDHHPVQSIPEVHYFNPLQNKPESNEPVSFWCYQVSRREKDMWIAMIGCLGDWFLPPFAGEFAKKYADIFDKFATPAQALYGTELGKIIKILSFALKDTTSNVIKLLKALIETESPYEILKGEKKHEQTLERFSQVSKTYLKFLEKAKNLAENNSLLWFQYSGALSLSGELANELFYFSPQKVIVVAYIKDNKVNISLRGKNDIRILVKKDLEGIEGTGGGHEHACGATVHLDDLPKFRDNLIKAM